MSNIDKQTLRERYSPKPVPKCHICGEEMTIQRISASRITYGCTGATYDDKGCHYAEGRSIADDHYEQSRVTVVDVSDTDVREQLEAAEKRNAEQREYYEGVIADGSKRIAELESKNANLRTIAHEQNELAIRANLDSNNDAVEMDRLHKRIAELEARKVILPDRKSEIFWPGDAAEFDILGYVIAVKSAIRAAGIKVKG